MPAELALGHFGHSRLTPFAPAPSMGGPEHGPVKIRTPRDRDGSFEPMIVRKRQRRFEGFDDKILALYSRGMSVRDVQAHLAEIYGVEVSHGLISQVTDAVMDDAREWQQRAAEVVNQYLNAFYRGNFETARTLLADDLSFKGPSVQWTERTRSSTRPRGCEESSEATAPSANGATARRISTLYEMKLETPAGKVPVLVSEWNTVRDGEVATAILVFDTSFERSSRRQAARRRW